MGEMKEITGQTLIDMGYEPSKWFGMAIEWANKNNPTEEELREFIEEIKPPPPIEPFDKPKHFYVNMLPQSDEEMVNYAQVQKTMSEVMKTPTVISGAVMPDACPAGPIGTIPVGGVVQTKNAIHPAMHSADICCSVMATNLGDADPKEVMDKGFELTHFGGGGRDYVDGTLPPELEEEIKGNIFTKQFLKYAKTHLGTQGSSNHFYYVGVSRDAGDAYLVTHHGSRGFGARVYKHGKRIAESFRREISPKTNKRNAWIPYDTDEGREYWEAIQIVRKWTKLNHELIHGWTSRAIGVMPYDRFWNEHNFVFKDGDTFYHAKGATPLDDKFVPDSSKGRRLIPLNMSEPILIVRGKTTDNNLGFAPHGVGRNMSRAQHKKSLGHKKDKEIFEEETKGLDVRLYSGNVDISELPSAYKNSDMVQRQIEKYGLGEVVDRIMPYGTIMAGDWKKDAPWRK